MVKRIIDNSRIKRGIEDSKKYSESNRLKILFYVFSAFIVALVSFAGEYISGYQLFLLLFLGGLIAPVLLGLGLFIYSLFKPFNRFRFGVASIGPLGSDDNKDVFALEPYSRKQNIGSIKVKFILPNNELYDWEKVEKNTFDTGDMKSYIFDKPKNLKLMEGVYQVKVKSSIWGFPYLLIAENKFLYENNEWKKYTP